MKCDLIHRIREQSRPLDPLPAGVPPDLHPIDGVETVLFDIYGTLLVSGSGEVGTASATDTPEALTQALIAAGYSGDCTAAGRHGPELLKAEIARSHAAARAGGAEFPEVDILQIWEKVIGTLSAMKILEPDDDEPRRMRLAVEYEVLVNPVWPMPGAEETIASLRARGFRLGIVSNAQFYTPLTITALFGKTVEELGFDPSLCVWSCEELRAKPETALFRKLTPRIDLARSLYVGNDMLNDIWTASQTGCRTILFAGDRRSLRLREQDPRCHALKPDGVIDDLRQIPERV